MPFLYWLFGVINIKKTLYLFGVSFFVYLFIQIPLASLLKVDKPNFIGMTPFIHMIAAPITQGYPLDEAQKNFIEEMISVESIKDNYTCISGNPLYFNNPDFKFEKTFDNTYANNFYSFAISVIRRSIPEVIGNRACLFLATIGVNYKTFVVGNPGISEPITSKYSVPQYQETAFSLALWNYVNSSQSSRIIYYVFWAALAYIPVILLVMLIRRNKATWGFGLTIFINLVALLIGGVGPDYRFVYYVYLAGTLSLGMLFIPKIVMPNYNIKLKKQG